MLSKEKAIDNIILLKNDWDWMEFQIKMLKSEKSNLESILALKSQQITGLQSILESYKDYSKEIKPKFWQSPFYDVIFFIAGFISAIYLIGAL